ncbi:MAG: hypothetical protein ACRD2C_20670 [Acidimicrobiales bacterium]
MVGDPARLLSTHQRGGEHLAIDDLPEVGMPIRRYLAGTVAETKQTRRSGNNAGRGQSRQSRGDIGDPGRLHERPHANVKSVNDRLTSEQLSDVDGGPRVGAADHRVDDADGLLDRPASQQTSRQLHIGDATPQMVTRHAGAHREFEGVTHQRGDVGPNNGHGQHPRGSGYAAVPCRDLDRYGCTTTCHIGVSEVDESGGYRASIAGDLPAAPVALPRFPGDRSQQSASHPIQVSLRFPRWRHDFTVCRGLVSHEIPSAEYLAYCKVYCSRYPQQVSISHEKHKGPATQRVGIAGTPCPKPDSRFPALV